MAEAMGMNPAEQKYVPFRITDRKFVENYFKILHHPLEKQGVDFWWLDWQQESNTELTGVNLTFWLNYLHFTDQEREGKRPLLFHRWGGLGNHRYEIGFSGDVISNWDSLAFQPSFTAQAANVAYAYWSHDIGGHLPGKVDPELYTRWIQFGAFSPILRTHTTKNEDAERRVWAFPEPYSDVMADTLRLRARRMPYIYTEARRTYDTGVAFLRPLYYDWPEQDGAYKARNEYMFGDEVIAAPVVSPADPNTGLASESIWLPPGDWIEQPTGKRFHGPVTVQRSCFLEQIPIFERPGTIVPMQPPMLHSTTEPLDPLIVQIMPLDDGQQSQYTLYEDSTKGRDYEVGEFRTTTLHASRNDNVLQFTVDPVQGSFPGMLQRRALQLELPGDWPPSKVQVNGRSVEYTTTPGQVGWTFKGNTMATVVLTEPSDVHAGITIKVTRDSESCAHPELLDGFSGKMLLLRHAYDEANPLWGVNDLVAAMQTGERISYRPKNAFGEVRALDDHLKKARFGLDQVHTRTSNSSSKLADSQNQSASPDRRLDRAKYYLKLVAEGTR